MEMLRELVSIPSVSSADPRLDQSNRPVIERMAQWARESGFEVELVDIEGTRDKLNLIATLGSGEGGLVFAGHSDTVPFDEQAWQTDPFELQQHDGLLYGLGTADMKGALACMLHAARGLDRSRLRRPLTLLVTADEESTMSGARALERMGRPKARHAVVGEPTGLGPVRKHKGILMEHLLLEGRSGHSSNPAHGASALEAMSDVLVEIRAFRSELQQSHRDGEFEVPEPTLNLGRVDGGDAPNRICAQCELRFDLRAIPRMHDNAALREQLRARVQRRLQGTGVTATFRALFEGIGPFETAAEAPVVRHAERLTGQSARAAMFGTEAPFFCRLGMEPIVLGPGDIGVAHQPGEHVARSELLRGVEIYRELAQRLCIEDGS